MQSQSQNDAPMQLLASVAEQLKLPLLQIAQYAELAEMTGTNEGAPLIKNRASTAIMLLDSYLLGLELSDRQSQLELEPVSISSLLTDVAHRLDESAKQYGVPLELCIEGRFGPVMAHSRGLSAALLSLGLACVEAHPASGLERPIRLSAYRTRYGIVAGIYGVSEDVTPAILREGQHLQGRAKQTLPLFSHASAAGVYVADAILRAMTTELRASKHHLQRGLAATFQPSRQLQLV